MFSTGTRVVVVSSTSSGEKIGPKSGSIGYVSDFENLKPLYSKPLSVYFSIQNIVFHRYGYENGTRRETKYFINVTPICEENETGFEEEQLPDLIKAHLEGIGNLKFDNENYTSFRNHLSEQYGNRFRSTHFGVLAPSYSLNELANNVAEFGSWVSSLMSNSDFQDMLVTFKEGFRHIKEFVGSDTFSLIEYMAASRDHREERIESVSYKTREDIVKALQFMSSVFNRGGQNVRREGCLLQLEDLLNRGYCLRTRDFMSSVLERFFNVEGLHIMKLARERSYNIGAQSACKGIEYLLFLRKHLVSLARSLEVNPSKT